MIEGTEEVVKDYIIETPYIGYGNVTGLDFVKTFTSCGACAVCMILSSHKIPINTKKFIEDGHKNNGYTPNGWVHSYLVKKLKENGLSYTQLENCQIKDSLEQIKESILAKKPVIASVNKFCLEQTIFHIILLVGIRLNSKKSILGFFYHDSAATGFEKGAYRYVSVENFIQFWRKMMIIEK